MVLRTKTVLEYGNFSNSHILSLYSYKVDYVTLGTLTQFNVEPDCTPDVSTKLNPDI